MQPILINMLLDAIMMMAIIALWLMWFRQGKQRKKVEDMLAKAASELQEATALLESIMVQQPELKQHQDIAFDHKSIATQAVENMPSIPKPQAKNQTRHLKPNKRTRLSKHAVDTNQSAKIMRLKREGLNAETISEQLAIPIAQVRLMLLLQMPKV